MKTEIRNKIQATNRCQAGCQISSTRHDGFNLIVDSMFTVNIYFALITEPRNTRLISITRQTELSITKRK